MPLALARLRDAPRRFGPVHLSLNCRVSKLTSSTERVPSATCGASAMALSYTDYMMMAKRLSPACRRVLRVRSRIRKMSKSHESALPTAAHLRLLNPWRLRALSLLQNVDALMQEPPRNTKTPAD